MAAFQPPLSYSLPAFHPDGYRNVRRWLENLRELDFRWVTLHPAWLVYDEAPPRIRPDAPDVHSAVQYAGELGLKVQVEPHLDWETTLTGGPYDWRRRMRVDPAGPYFDLVIGPMAALKPDRLTLGSELDVSVYEFTKNWIEVAARTEGVVTGHKLNHNALERRDRFRLGEYLRRLDYVAFSFYPAIEFEDAAGDLMRDLRDVAGPLPEFAIGEFGLGCTDTTKPWHFEATSFQMPEHFELRRDYYLRFLEWAAAQRYTSSPVTFWTAGHFDFLGVLEQTGLELFRDDVLREAVSEYNRVA
jgi:hypothetical protein